VTNHLVTVDGISLTPRYLVQLGRGIWDFGEEPAVRGQAHHIWEVSLWVSGQNLTGRAGGTWLFHYWIEWLCYTTSSPPSSALKELVSS